MYMDVVSKLNLVIVLVSFKENIKIDWMMGKILDSIIMKFLKYT